MSLLQGGVHEWRKIFKPRNTTSQIRQLRLQLLGQEKSFVVLDRLLLLFVCLFCFCLYSFHFLTISKGELAGFLYSKARIYFAT